MTVETTPWWAFILIGFLVGFQWGFTGLGLVLQRRDWKKQLSEWRWLEMLEAEHDVELAELNEVFRAQRNRHLRFARRITLADLGDLRYGATDGKIGMEKRGSN